MASPARFAPGGTAAHAPAAR
ncbi:protein of unknown function [Hyphomicrobium sp. 1Nfss2.1]